MCQEAARKTDLCVHGGMVKDGSPDTDIGGLAAARWGDGHICPLHPPGRITSASATVFINSVGAARKLDTILCVAPATPAPGTQPHKVAAHYKLNPDNEEDWEKALYADYKGSDSDNDGKNDTHEVGLGMVSISKQGETKDGLGGRFKMDAMTAKGSAFQQYGGTKVEGKASMVSMEGSVYKGPPGDNGKNPYLEGGASGDILSANASYENLMGYDGKRIGVGTMASAGAAVLSGEAKGRVGIPLGWLGLKDWSIDIKGGVSGSLESVGAGAGAMAFYDTQEKRFHLKGLLDIAAVLGVGLNIDISIGKKFGAATPPAPAPDAVKLGCSTVFIGG
jgi:uncharacterized Zn-binding protein involved in type VI secretion